MDIFQWILQNSFFKNIFYGTPSGKRFWYLENWTFNLLILITHDVLKIYRIIQYSKDIFKCNMVKNNFFFSNQFNFIHYTEIIFWVKHNKVALVQNIIFCFLNSMIQKQKHTWVVKNFLINIFYLYSIEKV